MPKLTQKTMLTIAIAGVLFATVSCSATEPAAPSASDSAAGSGSSTSVTDTETETRSVPQQCAALDLAPGASLPGESLGECVASALSSYGSGVMHLTGDNAGEAVFTYDPEYSVQASLTSPTGDVRIVYSGGEMWVDSGDGYVRGDLESAVFEEQVAGMAAELYRFYSDLEQTAQLVASQPTWSVDQAQETLTQPNGDSVSAYRIVNAAPFTWNEIEIQEFVVWFGDDWVPVGTQATTSMMGFTGTNGQRFTDLGEPVVIEVPAV